MARIHRYRRYRRPQPPRSCRRPRSPPSTDKDGCVCEYAAERRRGPQSESTAGPTSRCRRPDPSSSWRFPDERSEAHQRGAPWHRIAPRITPLRPRVEYDAEVHQEWPRDPARGRHSNRPEGTVLPLGPMEVLVIDQRAETPSPSMSDRATCWPKPPSRPVERPPSSAGSACRPATSARSSASPGHASPRSTASPARADPNAVPHPAPLPARRFIRLTVRSSSFTSAR